MASDRIYVTGIPPAFENSDLKDTFKTVGKIKLAYIVKEEGEKPKHYGIVRFYNPDSVQQAILLFNDKENDQGRWVVKVCEKRQYRMRNLIQNYRNQVAQYGKSNLFVKGIPETWNENKLREIFEKYGEIKSVRIQKANAFVWLSSQEEAKNAITEEKSKDHDGVKLNVSVWLPKATMQQLIFKKKQKRIIAKAVPVEQIVAEIPEIN